MSLVPGAADNEYEVAMAKAQAADPVYTEGTNQPLTQTLSGYLRMLLAAGAAVIGKVGIDQTTPGTTNAVTVVDAAGTALDYTTPVPTSQSSPYPANATPITGASGAVAAATATATLANVSGKTTYITGFEVTGAGATSGLPVSVTVTGTITGTLTYSYTAVAGVLLANQPLIVAFPYPIPATGPTVDIVVTCPSLGTGNTKNAVVAHGFVL